MTNSRLGLGRSERLTQCIRGLIMRFLQYCRSTGWRRRARVYARKLWRGWNAALIAVPLALAFIEMLAEQTELRLLLFPSLASIAYLLFTRPVGPHAPMLGAVIAPSIGAGIGTLILQPGFLRRSSSRSPRYPRRERGADRAGGRRDPRQGLDVCCVV